MKVGVVCNINARRNAKGIASRIRAILKEYAYVFEETERIDQLEDILSKNIDKVDVWSFVGGDGTLNAAMNLLWEKTGKKKEIEIPILVGKAGTLNAVAEKIPLKGDLDDIMIRFYEKLSSIGKLPVIPRDNIRKFNTIKISFIKPELGEKICFSFFLGVPYLISKRVIESRISSKRSILQTIYSSIAKFVFGQDEERIIRQIQADIEIEGKPYPYKSHYVIIGSIFREPALFFRPFAEPEKYKEGFYFLVYSGDVWTALRNFRTYARGEKRPPHSFSDVIQEAVIRADGGINFDGELVKTDYVEIKLEPGPIVNLIKV